MWVRADGEKAAPLWAERMRRGRRREGANLRERAKVGLEQRRPHQANSARRARFYQKAITIEGPASQAAGMGGQAACLRCRGNAARQPREVGIRSKLGEFTRSEAQSSGE
jgi:hypothetical protein